VGRHRPRRDRAGWAATPIVRKGWVKGGSDWGGAGTWAGPGWGESRLGPREIQKFEFL
jgi:hypothetical protein